MRRVTSTGGAGETDRDDDDAAVYDLWREFFDRRRAHLGQRQVVSRNRMVDLAVETVICLQHTVQLEAWTAALLADVAQVERRIRASQPELVDIASGHLAAR